MVLNMKHTKFGNGRIIAIEPKFKDAMHLADFFDAPYEMFLESKVKEYQKHLEEVDIRMDK